MKYPILELHNYLERIKKFFDPSGKIPIELLEQTLLRYEDDKGDKMWYLVPANEKHNIDGARVWYIKRMSITVDKTTLGRRKLKQFIDMVTMLSGESGLHPALVVSFFLCDLRGQNDEIWVLLENGRPIISLPSFQISSGTLGKAYSAARRLQGTMVRGRSKRTRTLLQFYEHSLGLSGEEKLRDWNATYPSWKYKNVESLRVVVSRLTEKMITDNGLWNPIVGAWTSIVGNHE